MKNSFITWAVSIGCSLVAYNALASTASDSSNSLIPNLTPGFELSAAPLYLQPNSNALDYAILASPFNPEVASPIESPSWQVESIDPNYHFGFDVGIRYVFPDSVYDVMLDWTYLNTTDSDSVHADPTQFVGPAYEIGPDAGSIREADAEATFAFDSLNLDFGWYQNFTKRVQVRFFAGVNASHIKQDLTTTFQDDAQTFSVTSDNLSRYNGIGPRFGVRAVYYITPNWGIVGQASAAELVGTLHTQTDFTSVSQELTNHGIPVNNQEIDDDNIMQVVPEFDTKLAVTYIRPLNKEHTATIELGYQAAVYVNAIREVYPTTLVEGTHIQTGTVAVATMGSSQSNFSVNGAYLRLAVSL